MSVKEVVIVCRKWCECERDGMSVQVFSLDKQLIFLLDSLVCIIIRTLKNAIVDFFSPRRPLQPKRRVKREAKPVVRPTSRACTVEPLYRGHHWDPAGCPIYSGTSL